MKNFNVLMLSGKGGVGKNTISASIAWVNRATFPYNESIAGSRYIFKFNNLLL